MRLGGTLPSASAAALCLQNANLPNFEQSLVPASTHGESAMMEVAQQMRRLSGALGAPTKTDVFLAEDDASPASPPAEMEELESRKASREDKVNFKYAPRQVGGGWGGEGEKLNSINSKTCRWAGTTTPHVSRSVIVVQYVPPHSCTRARSCGDLPFPQVSPKNVSP